MGIPLSFDYDRGSADSLLAGRDYASRNLHSWQTFNANQDFYEAVTTLPHRHGELADIKFHEHVIKENYELKNLKDFFETKTRTLEHRLSRTHRALKLAKMRHGLRSRHSKHIRSLNTMSSGSHSSARSSSDPESNTSSILDLEEGIGLQERVWRQGAESTLHEKSKLSDLLDGDDAQYSCCSSSLLSPSPPDASCVSGIPGCEDKSVSLSETESDSSFKTAPERWTVPSSVDTGATDTQALGDHLHSTPDYLRYFTVPCKEEQEGFRGSTLMIQPSSENVAMNRAILPTREASNLAVATTLSFEEYITTYRCIPVGPIFFSNSQHDDAAGLNRLEAGNDPNNLRYPDMFKHGLAFRPAQNDDNALRMVVIANLPHDVTLDEVMDRVQGGYVVSAFLLNTVRISGGMTVMVTFLYGRSAVDFASNTRLHPLDFSGRRASIKLIPTATWPLRIGLQRRIYKHGETRCLEIMNLHGRLALSHLKASLQLVNRTRYTWVQRLVQSTASSVKIIFQTVDAASWAYLKLRQMPLFRGCHFRFLQDPCDVSPTRSIDTIATAQSTWNSGVFTLSSGLMREPTCSLSPLKDFAAAPSPALKDDMIDQNNLVIILDENDLIPIDWYGVRFLSTFWEMMESWS